jgi:hypothetical protein
VNRPCISIMIHMMQCLMITCEPFITRPSLSRLIAFLCIHNGQGTGAVSLACVMAAINVNSQKTFRLIFGAASGRRVWDHGWVFKLQFRFETQW